MARVSMIQAQESRWFSDEEDTGADAGAGTPSRERFPTRETIVQRQAYYDSSEDESAPPRRRMADSQNNWSMGRGSGRRTSSGVRKKLSFAETLEETCETPPVTSTNSVRRASSADAQRRSSSADRPSSASGRRVSRRNSAMAAPPASSSSSLEQKSVQESRKGASDGLTVSRTHCNSSSSSGTLNSGSSSGPSASLSRRASSPSSAVRVSTSKKRVSSSEAPRRGVSPASSMGTHSYSRAALPAPPPSKQRGNVSVFVRLRPGPRHEMCTFAETANHVQVRRRSLLVPQSGQNESSTNLESAYWCDRAFSPETSQPQLYEEAVAPIVGAVLQGYNGAVIAYGQTGSGKTHTIVGSGTAHTRGVIPRAVEAIFASLQKRNHWFVTVRILEVYNERTRDLLSTGPQPAQVEICDADAVSGDTGRAFHCPSATEREVHSPEEALQALNEAVRRRETARTEMNDSSSRSHLIFTLVAGQSDDLLHATIKGRLHLVDLAGSERLKRSEAQAQLRASEAPTNSGDGGAGAAKSMRGEKERRREASTINKSLSQLALVVQRLTQANGSSSCHVPYRDSALTQLLADSFGGNSKTCLIITCSPLLKDRDETRCALEFGKRANLVRNAPEINIEMEEGLEPSDVVKALVAKELAQLRKERDGYKQLATEAAAALLEQQRLRQEEVKKLEAEKVLMERLWLSAATTAAESQEEAATRVAKLQRQLEKATLDINREREEKANIRNLLVAALEGATRLHEASAEPSPMEGILRSAREDCLDLREKSSERGVALRRGLDLAGAEASRQQKLRESRFAMLDDEAQKLQDQWRTLLNDGDPLEALRHLDTREEAEPELTTSADLFYDDCVSASAAEDEPEIAAGSPKTRGSPRKRVVADAAGSFTEATASSELELVGGHTASSKKKANAPTQLARAEQESGQSSLGQTLHVYK